MTIGYDIDQYLKTRNPVMLTSDLCDVISTMIEEEEELLPLEQWIYDAKNFVSYIPVQGLSDMLDVEHVDELRAGLKALKKLQVKQFTAFIKDVEGAMRKLGIYKLTLEDDTPEKWSYEEARRLGEAIEKRHKAVLRTLHVERRIAELARKNVTKLRKRADADELFLPCWQRTGDEYTIPNPRR